MTSDETFITAYRPQCTKHEHDIDYFYLDIYGNVTIRRGHLAVSWNKKKQKYILAYPDEEQILTNYLYIPDGTRHANIQEIEDDIKAVEAMPFGRKITADKFKAATYLHIKDIDGLWQADVKFILSKLNRYCRYFADDATPFEAKLVLLDLAFQSGYGHFIDTQSDNIIESKKKARQVIHISHFTAIRLAMLENDIAS